MPTVSEQELVFVYRSKKGRWYRRVNFGGKRRTGWFVVPKKIAKARTDAEAIFRLFEPFIAEVGRAMHPESNGFSVPLEVMTDKSTGRVFVAQRVSRTSVFVS